MKQVPHCEADGKLSGAEEVRASRMRAHQVIVASKRVVRREGHAVCETGEVRGDPDRDTRGPVAGSDLELRPGDAAQAVGQFVRGQPRLLGSGCRDDNRAERLAAFGQTQFRGG